MARAGSFKSQTKGTAHGSRTHPLESIARRFGYQEYERVLGKQLEKAQARAQIPVTRQTIRANKANERTERLNQRIEATGKDAQQLAQRVAEAKAQVGSTGLAARQSQAILQQQRMFTRETGVQPIDTTLGDRARLAAQEHSESIAALKAAKSQFQSTRRRTESLASRARQSYGVAAATANSVKVIADWQNANLEANRLRARRKLAGWT